MIYNIFFSFAIMGVYTIMIGSILPMMRDEYGLSYEMCGSIVSAHNIGNMVAGIFAGAIAMILSVKTAYIIFTAITAVGFALTLFTGNPVFLLCAFLLAGIGRGGCNNYINLAISVTAEGRSAPNNLLHCCFSTGALLAPFIVLLCTKQSEKGWRTVVIFVVVLLAVSLILSSRMDVSRIEYGQEGKNVNKTFAFLKDMRFALPMICLFMYQCIESSMMGWLVSYFVESGYVSESFSQILNSILWASILVGCIVCVAIANKISTPELIKVLSIGLLAFTVVLLVSDSFALAIVATIGIGLSASGLCGTIIACSGEVFAEYAYAMSGLIAVAGAGASLWPYIIGFVAETAGIKAGMSSILIPGVLLVIASFINAAYFKKNR